MQFVLLTQRCSVAPTFLITKTFKMMQKRIHSNHVILLGYDLGVRTKFDLVVLVAFVSDVGVVWESHVKQIVIAENVSSALMLEGR